MDDRCVPVILEAVPKRVISAAEFTDLLAHQDRYRRRCADAMAAGVVPVTRGRKGEEYALRVHDTVDRSLARIETGSPGLPVSIHVASQWQREELVLAIMARLHENFGETAEFPRTPTADLVSFR